MKHFIIPVFISHKGCPHKCIFCNQFNIADKPVSPDNIESIVNSYISSQIKKFGKIHKKYKKKQISFYGGSFTCLDENVMKKYLEKAYYFVEKKLIDSLRLSTRPDCINQYKLNILKKYNVDTIEIGAQSLDDMLLRNLKRGHLVEDIIKACNLIKENNFILGLQLMVGIPKEDIKSIEKTINILTEEIKPDFIRIYPLLVIKGTEIEKLYLSRKFTPITLEEAVKRVKVIMDKCKQNKIKVIRVGLQPSEILKENIVAGPFCENFRDLIKNHL